MLDDPGEQIGFVSILQNAHAHQIAVSEAMEFVGVGVLGLAVGFVGNKQDRFVDFSESIGHFGVQGYQSAARVDNKQEHIGFFDGREDLQFDLVGQIIDVLDSDSTGIDQFEMATFMFDQGRKAISGHPGKVFDDRQAATVEPIKDRTFADIRSAYNCNARNSHRKTMDR